MTTKVIKNSDVINIPGLFTAVVYLVQVDGRYVVFMAKVNGKGSLKIAESSVQASKELEIACRIYEQKISCLEG